MEVLPLWGRTPWLMIGHRVSSMHLPHFLIQAVLQRVLQQSHRLLLVTPLWLVRIWFLNLCAGFAAALLLPDRKDLLSVFRGYIFSFYVNDCD